MELARWIGSLMLGAVTIATLYMMNSRVEPSYHSSIVRTVASPEEAALITRAEAECPPYADVAAVFSRTPPEESAECLWWYAEYDEDRSLYAITADAIEFYDDQGRQAAEDGVAASFSLNYAAWVEHNVPDVDDPEKMFTVVHMSLEYSSHCGGCCGGGFSKERTVYFDEAGEVVAVEGDGVTTQWVA